MTTGPHVFLFDVNAEGIPSYYGGYFDPAFLRALLAADIESVTCSRIKRGDAMIAHMVRRIAAISHSERRSSHTVDHDMDLYKTIIWDLTDALKQQWHTLDLDASAMTLGNHSVHCIMLPTLSSECRDLIDKSLRTVVGYMGAFEIDPGNPVYGTYPAICSFMTVQLLTDEWFVSALSMANK